MGQRAAGRQQVRIITNWHWRPLLYWHELTHTQQARARQDYDWMTQEEREEAQWMIYRGELYTPREFMSTAYLDRGAPEAFDEWDGYLNDTFFSGVLIKIDVVWERYRIATFYAGRSG